MTTQQTTDQAAILQRLDRLERQNRWMKRGGAVLLVLVGAAALMGSQAPAKDRTDDSNAFILRDRAGKERAGLTLAANGPVLRFLDEGGKERLRLGMFKDVPGFVFYDSRGKRQATLSAATEGVRLFLYDADERPRAWLRMSKDDIGLHVLGEEGRRHAGLQVDPDGTAVWNHDKRGKIHSGYIGTVPGESPHGEAHDPLFPKH
jgi:hypothetical protein